jgi:hypothetical protein
MRHEPAVCIRCPRENGGHRGAAHWVGGGGSGGSQPAPTAKTAKTATAGGRVESTGHAWLHSRCWSAWYAGRRAVAAAALLSMGSPDVYRDCLPAWRDQREEQAIKALGDLGIKAPNYRKV